MDRGKTSDPYVVIEFARSCEAHAAQNGGLGTVGDNPIWESVHSVRSRCALLLGISLTRARARRAQITDGSAFVPNSIADAHGVATHANRILPTNMDEFISTTEYRAPTDWASLGNLAPPVSPEAELSFDQEDEFLTPHWHIPPRADPQRTEEMPPIPERPWVGAVSPERLPED